MGEIIARNMCIIPQAETQSSAPEDGWNYRPKQVELIEIINKKFVIFASSWLFILLWGIFDRILFLFVYLLSRYNVIEWQKHYKYKQNDKGVDNGKKHTKQEQSKKEKYISNYISTTSITKIWVLKPFKPKRRLLYLKPQSVQRCKHFSSRL